MLCCLEQTCGNCGNPAPVGLHALADADHAGYRVKSFAASADCKLAVVVLFDSTVAVWDMVSMECICMLQSWGDRDAARVHSAGINAAYLTPSGSRAVTVSGDHTARVWDIATAECRCVLQGVLNTLSTFLCITTQTHACVMVNKQARAPYASLHCFVCVTHCVHMGVLFMERQLAAARGATLCTLPEPLRKYYTIRHDLPPSSPSKFMGYTRCMGHMQYVTCLLWV